MTYFGNLSYQQLETECLAIIARSPYPYSVVPGDFQTLFPQATLYAENRIYRDIPMLVQRRQDNTLSTTAGMRNLSLDGTQFPILVPERIALVIPTGATLLTGTQIQCIPTSLDFIDMYWPVQGTVWTPTATTAMYWAIQGDMASDYISPTIVIAPTPDNVYTVVVTGLFKRVPISTNDQYTYISTIYPELLTAACMVWLSGALLRNYAASGIPGAPTPDEPGMPVFWEGQYQTLMRAARAEELRRRQQGTNWLDMPPAPETPPVAARAAQ